MSYDENENLLKQFLAFLAEIRLDFVRLKEKNALCGKKSH
jgi:hypothetical protein